MNELIRSIPQYQPASFAVRRQTYQSFCAVRHETGILDMERILFIKYTELCWFYDFKKLSTSTITAKKSKYCFFFRKRSGKRNKWYFRCREILRPFVVAHILHGKSWPWTFLQNRFLCTRRRERTFSNNIIIRPRGKCWLFWERCGGWGQRRRTGKDNTTRRDQCTLYSRVSGLNVIFMCPSTATTDV